MFLTTGSQKHRDQLAPLRAEAWAEGITPEQFAERNRQLYDHPFGGTRIETHVFLDEKGELLSSCDTLDVDFGILDPKGEYVEDRGLLLASVFTPTAKRGKGYASRMLEELFAGQSDKAWCLYSDIEPEFYERFEFLATPISEVTEIIPLEEDRLVEAEPIEMEEAVRGLRQWRSDLVKGGSPGLALLPDPQWVDWELLKFAYFAETRGKTLSDVCYQIATEFAIVVPDFVAGDIKTLFATDESAARYAVQAVARATGIRKSYSWRMSGLPSPGASVPMAWSREFPDSRKFLDLQFGDWW